MTTTTVSVPACAGPGPCTRAARVRGLCFAHYVQSRRGSLRPLRDPASPAKQNISLRISAKAALAVRENPARAREVLEAWAASRKSG